MTLGCLDINLGWDMPLSLMVACLVCLSFFNPKQLVCFLLTEVPWTLIEILFMILNSIEKSKRMNV